MSGRNARSSARFWLGRVAMVPLSVFVIVTLSFLVIELIPGDPARALVGDQATEESLEEAREKLGLDDPLTVRYANYLTGMVRGDLGSSFFTDQPVLDDIRRFLPATLELVLMAMVVAAVLGGALGLAGAYYSDRWPDRASRWMTTIFQSIPHFLLALVLIYLLFFVWGVAPPPMGRGGLDSGWEPVTGSIVLDSILARDWDLLLSSLHQSMMPVLALGIVYSAYIAKTTRATMRVALASPQVEFARAAGLGPRRVVHYAFTTARTPILTYCAILVGSMIGGAAIIETIFAWRGVGQWAITGILRLDIPVIQGFILVAGLLALLTYLALDVVVTVLDPRVKYD